MALSPTADDRLALTIASLLFSLVSFILSLRNFVYNSRISKKKYAIELLDKWDERTLKSRLAIRLSMPDQGVDRWDDDKVVEPIPWDKIKTKLDADYARSGGSHVVVLRAITSTIS